MHWVWLGIAIMLEVGGSVCMKMSQGFTRLGPSVLMFVLYGLGFLCLTVALKRLDISVTYAIWSGVGTAAIAIIGVYAFKEPLSAVQIASIALIILGVVGLNIERVEASARASSDASGDGGTMEATDAYEPPP